MSRSLLLSLLIYLLLIIALVTMHGPLLALAVPLVLYTGVALLFGPREIKLSVSRTLSADRVPQGSPVDVELTITNTGSVLEQVIIQEQLPPNLAITDGQSQVMASLAAGETVIVKYTLTGSRGYYQLPGISVEATDRFGVFKKQTDVESTSRLFILPRVHKLPQLPIRPRRTRVYSGLIPARRGGPGIEFFGLREYQPGDPPRWVNHRASARAQQTLFVNQFEQERAVDVGLIMDARLRANAFYNNHSLFEYVVHATAALADSFIAQGNRVGLFVHGGYFDWTFPGYGKTQRERIFQVLARAQLHDSDVFQDMKNLPAKLFPLRSQLVFISPLRETDAEDLVNLRARGYQILIISPDPVDFESRLMKEDGVDVETVELAARIARLDRAQLFHRLQQAGIRVFEWQVETPFHQLAQNTLTRIPLWARGPGE